MKRSFAFFPQAVAGTDDEVRKTIRWKHYEYRYYYEVDEDDQTEWIMYQAREPGSEEAFTRCIIGISC